MTPEHSQIDRKRIAWLVALLARTEPGLDPVGRALQQNNNGPCYVCGSEAHMHQLRTGMWVCGDCDEAFTSSERVQLALMERR